MRRLQELPGVDSVVKIPDSDRQKGDLQVQFMGATITIECKSIATGSVKYDSIYESWAGFISIKNSDKRVVLVEGTETSLTNLQKGQFDILAINCFAVNGSWDFVFVENRFLLERDTAPGFISSKIHVDPLTTPGLTEDIHSLLYKVLLQKIASAG
jgi:hypothetical protein